MDTVENRAGTPRGDAETVRLLQQRRPEGLRLLLETYGPKVRWNLKRDFGTLNELELDEVVNLAAHRAWGAAEDFEPSKGTVRAWFYMISRNCAVDVIRRESRERRHTEVEDWDGATMRVVKIEPQAPSSAAHKKFLSDLQICIGKLGQLQMSIIQADLSSGDVADAGELAKTFNTTKNSIYASRSIARKTLKRELMRLGHSLGDTPSLDS